jgi:hypothetical protein
MTGGLEYRRHDDPKLRCIPFDEREIFEPWPDEDDVGIVMTIFDNGWRVPSPAHA